MESDEKSAENPDPANEGMILAVSSSVAANENSGERMTTDRETSENVPELNVMENSTAERFVYSLHGLIFFPELGSA